MGSWKTLAGKGTRSLGLKFWSLILVILAVGGWRGYGLWERPPHVTEIAKAHGYVGLFYGLPQVNSDGSKLVFSQMDDLGIGVFLMDLPSGKKQLVHEKVSADDWFQNVDVWPWSPDGKCFVFTHTNLFICDGGTGKTLGEIMVGGVNGVASLAWLNDRSFIYADRGGVLHQIQEGQDQSWRELTDRHPRVGMDNLTVISSDTICWKKGNYIWSFNLGSKRATVLFHAQGNELEGFKYSKRSRQFLVNCTGKNGSSIRTMSYEDGALGVGSRIETASVAHTVQWLNGENAVCAYIADASGETETRHLEIASKPSASPMRLFEQGTVEGVAATADGQKLFIVGAISSEPASSLWEYTIRAGDLRCIVSGSEYPSRYAKRVESRQMAVKLGGRTFNYHVYEPVGLDPQAHRKYPVVIGDTLFRVLDPAYQNRVHGPYWAPMLANAGAYVVIVERPVSWGNEMGFWGEYVDWVYKKMVENPTIDPHRVYLYATSAETMQLRDYADSSPERWKGLILLSPTALPDLQELEKTEVPPKILVSQGALEGTNRVHDYQLEAARGGVRVEYFSHDNNAHILLGSKAMGERAEAMMKFVFGD